MFFYYTRINRQKILPMADRVLNKIDGPTRVYQKHALC